MRVRRNSRRSGFTLVEIMIATSIFALVSVGITRVLIQVLSMYSYDTGKLLVNRDLRKFTSEMTENATYANYFRIYPSYTSISRTVDAYTDPNDPNQGYPEAVAPNFVADGESGDLLLLVYKNPLDDVKISRIIYYYRVPGASDPAQEAGKRVFNRGPVRKYEWTPPDDAATQIDNLLHEIPNPDVHPIVLQSVGVMSPTLVQVAGSNPPKYQSWGLFYNFFERSIILKGELIQTGSQLNKKNTSATNTYNFTVSPRG